MVFRVRHLPEVAIDAPKAAGKNVNSKADDRWRARRVSYSSTQGLPSVSKVRTDGVLTVFQRNTSKVKYFKSMFCSRSWIVLFWNFRRVAVCGEHTGKSGIPAGYRSRGMLVSFFIIFFLPNRQSSETTFIVYFRTSRCTKSCDLQNNSKCEPKFVQKRLIALHPEGNLLKSEMFWFPVSCQCLPSHWWKQMCY